jgi:hypothetical protein
MTDQPKSHQSPDAEQPTSPSIPTTTPQEHSTERKPVDGAYHGGRDPDPSKS